MMNHVEGNFQIVISEEKFAVRASILDQFTVESQFAEETERKREGERERDMLPSISISNSHKVRYCEVIATKFIVQ